MSITAERRTARPRGLDGDTLSEAFQITVADNPDRVGLRTKGDEQSYTWAEYGERVRALAAGLAGLGLERGQTLALMLTNRPEFHFFDTAAMHLGAVPYSIYNTYAAAEIEHQIRDADSRIVVTELALLPNVLTVRDALDQPLEVVVVDGDGSDGTLTVADVEARAAEGFDFDAAWRAADPDDVVTLIYTSGTTGPPKGVQLSHRNLVECVRSYDEMIQFSDGGRVVSYLPMAHVAERNVSHYLPMFCGFTVTCCPDPREVLSYVQEVRPSWFFGVPRIWEKLKAGLEAMLTGLPDEEQRNRIQGALDAGRARVKLVQAGEEVPPEVEEAWRQADEQVLSNVRTMLGLDQIEACNVGAAPTPPEVIEFFHALGVPLAELWGMSETTAAGACNPPHAIKIGTVGVPAPGVEIKLAQDGEILVRGAVVMKGYRNLPDKTAEAIDAEGWMHTGDVGAFDSDGYLKIVDRKKELIINAAGKNMSPANIESKVKTSSTLIGQAVAIGDERPYNVALITLDPDAAPVFAQANGIEDASIAALAEHPAVVAEIQRGVDEANAHLSRPEQIKCFEILPAEWQPGGDELTPTMKLKRKPISAKYATEIEALYAG